MKTLLLDKLYKPIAFIDFRKTLKHVYKHNAEILSVWKDIDFYGDQEYPAILLLNKYIRRKQLKVKFSFGGVLRRDLYTCQYSGIQLPISELNVDHVISRKSGGKSDWYNCIACSKTLNNRKGSRSLEECGFMLMREPRPPKDVIAIEFALLDVVHDDWFDYFPGVKRLEICR
jgi:hypothetical protein